MQLKLSSDLALSGISTGIDTDSLVSAMMLTKQASINALKARQSQWQSKNTAMLAIEKALAGLRNVADGLQDMSKLRATSVSSSDQSLLTATATGSASEGSHQIVINRLATAERRVHEGLAGLDTLVGAGTFTYLYNGQTRALATTDTTTLDSLRGLINNDAENPGVTASVLEYESAPGKIYHLVLSGRDSGSDYGIQVTSTPAEFTNVFEQTQQANDCQIRVDGYPSGAWIERSSNTLDDDVIPGVRLVLHNTTADGETVRVSVNRDTGQFKKQIAAMVTAWNSMIDTVDSYTGYDATTRKAGTLQGEPTVYRVLSQLRATLGAVPGFNASSDSFAHLSQIGLEFDRAGKLELDEEVLSEATAADFNGVLALVAGALAGSSDSDAVQYASASDSTAMGNYSVNVEFDASGNISYATITGPSIAGWEPMSWVGTTLHGPAGSSAEGLALTVVYQGNASETASVRVRKGFAAQLYDAADGALDPDQGPIDLRKDQYKATIDSMTRRIERQQERLDNEEQRLRARFARMEQTLSQLNSQRSAIESMLTSLAGLQQQSSSNS